ALRDITAGTCRWTRCSASNAASRRRSTRAPAWGGGTSSPAPMRPTTRTASEWWRRSSCGLELVEEVSVAGRVTFPYVPGLLGFREAPIVLRACARVRARPDVLMCDGQGIAHPRRFGLACHVGYCLDVPTIGCAKSRL